MPSRTQQTRDSTSTSKISINFAEEFPPIEEDEHSGRESIRCCGDILHPKMRHHDYYPTYLLCSECHTLYITTEESTVRDLEFESAQDFFSLDGSGLVEPESEEEKRVLSLLHRATVHEIKNGYPESELWYENKLLLEDNEVVGYISYAEGNVERDIVILNEVYIRPSYRGEGYRSKLVEEFCSRHTEVWVDHIPAAEFEDLEQDFKSYEKEKFSERIEEIRSQ